LTAGTLGIAYARADAQYGSLRKRLWQRLAFAARYGHQSVTDLLGMPMSDFDYLEHGLAELLSQEATAMKATGGEDG
jgi:hypothetical protein